MRIHIPGFTFLFLFCSKIVFQRSWKWRTVVWIRQWVHIHCSGQAPFRWHLCRCDCVGMLPGSGSYHLEDSLISEHFLYSPRCSAGTCEQSFLPKLTWGRILHSVASGPLHQYSLDCFWKYSLGHLPAGMNQNLKCYRTGTCMFPVFPQVILRHTKVKWQVVMNWM